jgi:hypothetical protein
MTLKKYYQALMLFDWDFSYIQDDTKRKQHQDRYATLASLQHKSPQHEKMFKDFVKYNTALIRNPRLKPKVPK